MTIPIDAGKAVGKTINLSIVKSSWQTKNRRNYLNLIKSIYKMSKQGCPVSPLLFNTILKFLGSDVIQENEIKIVTTGMEKTNIEFNIIFSGKSKKVFIQQIIRNS